jgi:2-(1,2-epoxy-1,2-dihydrophenyl)acetyl-CoA isomerase
MNRPESMNALEYQLRLDLLDCFNKLLESDQARVVILTGSGKAFCAGGDLRELKNGLSVDQARKIALHGNKIILAIRNLEKPVIAAVNGAAFGAGFSIAMACDLIIATEEAKFCQVFIKVGLVPDLGATYFTPRLVGLQKSKELAFTAKIIKADELEKLGVINYVVPHEDLEKQAFDLARQIAEGPALALGLTKKLLNQSWNFSLEDILELEAKTQAGCMQSEDHMEGLAAFYKKRKHKPEK